MDCVRLPQHALQMPAQRSRSWKRSLVGLEAAWRRSIRAPLIDVGWRTGRCTSSRTMSELLFPHLWGIRPHLRKILNEFRAQGRVCRGSDPRHLRLTMDELLDRHMWGATPCIKDHPVARLDLPSMKRARQIEGHFMGKLGRGSVSRPKTQENLRRRWQFTADDIFVTPLPAAGRLPT